MADKQNDWMKVEARREQAVRNAVMAADRIILDASDGSVEEINYLTGQVALRFAEKVNTALGSALRRKELMERASSLPPRHKAGVSF